MHYLVYLRKNNCEVIIKTSQKRKSDAKRFVNNYKKYLDRGYKPQYVQIVK